MEKRLYVAYGSNLNKRQMKHRCPTAKLAGTGVIRDYRLEFKELYGSAFATIAPMKGEHVPAAVWELQPQDERALDIYEGYPKHYFKQDVPVEMEGKTITAMVYVMNLEAKFGIPTEHYLEGLCEGYEDCGFDVETLDKAAALSLQMLFAGNRGKEYLRTGVQREDDEYGGMENEGNNEWHETGNDEDDERLLP